MSSKNVFGTRRRGNATTISFRALLFCTSIFKQLEFEALNCENRKSLYWDIFLDNENLITEISRTRELGKL